MGVAAGAGRRRRALLAVRHAGVSGHVVETASGTRLCSSALFARQTAFRGLAALSGTICSRPDGVRQSFGTTGPALARRLPSAFDHMAAQRLGGSFFASILGTPPTS